MLVYESTKSLPHLHPNGNGPNTKSFISPVFRWRSMKYGKGLHSNGRLGYIFFPVIDRKVDLPLVNCIITTPTALGTHSCHRQGWVILVARGMMSGVGVREQPGSLWGSEGSLLPHLPLSHNPPTPMYSPTPTLLVYIPPTVIFTHSKCLSRVLDSLPVLYK